MAALTTNPAKLAPLLEVDAASLGQHGGLIDAMFEDRCLGVIVRGAFAEEAAVALLEGIESGAIDLPRLASEHYGGASYGQMLIVSPQDLGPYFERAGRMRGLRAGGVDFEARLVEIAGALAGGAGVALAEGPSGRAYAPLTIRVVEPGGSIAVHCENETVRFPAMAHLSTMIDLRTQLSFYTPLRLPEGGGELHLYPLRHGAPSGAPMRSMERSFEKIGDALGALSKVVPRVGVGDLLIFDAGRHYHGVTPVTGAISRWTMGGFLGRAAGDPGRVLFWS